MTVGVSVNLGAMEAMFDALEDDVVAAARPAAQAGAQVLYDAVKQNVTNLGRVTGNLASSIYQVYSQDKSGDGRAVYHVSWNRRKAPHGGLVEFGYIQRYATYVGKDGQWYTAVRAEMRGKPKPSRRAPQAVKDAYYVKLPQPKQVGAKAFLRSAVVKLPEAKSAVETELLRRLA
ncbi:HK97 gp10 family phage protein [Duganella aquatilis]